MQRSDNELFALFLAAALALALFMGLSDEAWRVLRIFWAGVATLSVMALMEPLRRGLAKSGGELPLRVFALLLLRGGLIGLLLGSLCVALLVI